MNSIRQSPVAPRGARPLLLLRLVLLFTAVLVSAASVDASEPRFIRGDFDFDDALTIGDVIATLGYLFQGQPAFCVAAGDLDDDGQVSISDPIYLLIHLFDGGAPPAAPYPGCGVDPTPDTLGCAAFSRCEVIAPAPPLEPSFGFDAEDRAAGVLLHSGELVVERTDLVLHGRHLGFSLTRTYRSANESDGPLGYGWDANIFRRLEVVSATSLILHDGSGRTDTFTLDGGFFEPPPGRFERIRAVGSQYEERDPHGTIHRYDGAGRLIAVEHRTGSALAYLYDPEDRLTQVIDEFGRELDLSYDALDRLVAVTDFSGRVVAYDFDVDGNLIEHRSPLVVGTPHGNDFPSGKREQYRYDFGNAEVRLAHDLVELVRPNEVEDGSGTPSLVVSYGDQPCTFDRVISLSLGGTNASGIAAGGTFSYEYDDAPSHPPPGATSRTRVIDRRGNTTDSFHDASGHVLRVVENPTTPSSITTDYEVDVDGHRVREILPLGNEIVWVYDSLNPDRFQRNNRVSVTRIPDPVRGGAPPALTITTEYEPLFNRVRTRVTAEGNDPTYLPQNGGVHSADRYTARSVYDWQEENLPPPAALDWGIVIPPGLLGLGDVNFDGRTDQRVGSRIRLEEPTVLLPAGSIQALAEGDTSQERITLDRYDDFGNLTEREDPRGNIDVLAYFPENDPDGDGSGLIPGRDPVTGGLRKQRIRDAFVGPRRLDVSPPVAALESYQRDVRGNIVTETDARGFVTRSTYDALDHRIVSEDPPLAGLSTGFQEFTSFDANGNRIRLDVEDWRPDTTGTPTFQGIFTHTWSYDILDNPLDRTIDATRDPAIPASPESESLVTEFRYDANENRVLVRSPVAVDGGDPAAVTEFVYDERDLLVSTTRGLGSPAASTTLFVYDDNRNLLRQIDAADSDGDLQPEETLTLYDGYDRPIGRVDKVGTVHTMEFDPRDRVVREEAIGVVDGTSSTPVLLSSTAHLYDEAGREIGTDFELFVPGGSFPILPVLPGEGALIPGDGALNLRFEYDANDRTTVRTEDDGASFQLEYDGLDRLVRQSDPITDLGSGEPAGQEYGYDAAGNVTEVRIHYVSPDGVHPPTETSTLYVYDPLDRVTRVTDPEGKTTRFTYDSRDNVTRVTDPRGPSIPDPLGLFTAGPINGAGNATEFFHDGANREWLRIHELHVGGEGGAPIDLTNPAIPTGKVMLGTEYDGNDRVVRRVDGNGHAVTTSYDPLDRPILRSYADGTTRVWTWDPDDHVTGLVDENGTIHSLTYDGGDRLIAHEVVVPPTLLPGTAVPAFTGSTTMTWEYDGLGRPTRSVNDNEPSDLDDDGVVETFYDSLSRIIEERENGAPVGSLHVADRRAALHYPDGATVITFDRDPLDRMASLELPGGFRIDRRYSGACPTPIEQTTVLLGAPPGPPVLSTTTTLDSNENVSGASTVSPAGPIQTHSAARNRNQQITSLSAAHTPFPGGGVYADHTIERNSLGQVTHLDKLIGAGAPSLTTRERRHGAAQELLDQVENGTPVQSPTYDATYGRNDGPNAASGAQERLSDADHLYQWNGFGKLETILDRLDPSVVIASYDYDAVLEIDGGRRITCTSPAGGGGGGGGAEQVFLYDRAEEIQENRGPGGGAPSVPVRQLFRGDLGAGDIAAFRGDPNQDGAWDFLFFTLRDATGSIVQLVDLNGVPREACVPDFPGRPLWFDPLSQNPRPESNFDFPFTTYGARYHAGTGLFWIEGRDFDPDDGSFLASDAGLYDDLSNHGNGNAFVGNRFLEGADRGECRGDGESESGEAETDGGGSVDPIVDAGKFKDWAKDKAIEKAKEKVEGAIKDKIQDAIRKKVQDKLERKAEEAALRAAEARAARAASRRLAATAAREAAARATAGRVAAKILSKANAVGAVVEAGQLGYEAGTAIRDNVQVTGSDGKKESLGNAMDKAGVEIAEKHGGGVTGFVKGCGSWWYRRIVGR